MDDTLTLALQKPVTIGETSYDHLELAEPTAGQLEKASGTGNTMTQNIVLIADVAKVPQAVVRKLCARDFNAAAAFLGGFTQPVPATGGTSSPS